MSRRSRGSLERDGFSILISGRDAALRAISGFRTDLPALTRTGLSSREVVDAVLDKRRLMFAARAAGFAQPRSVSCATLNSEARDAGRSIGYPLVVKPASTVFAAGRSLPQRSARIAPDEQALAPPVSDCGSQRLVQERLDGQVLSLGDVLTEHGKNAVALARYERTWPPRAGNAGCATTEPLPPGLVRSTQALLAGLGWQGLFELELIGTPDGEWVPVDLDPRPFGSLALRPPPALRWRSPGAASCSASDPRRPWRARFSLSAGCDVVRSSLAHILVVALGLRGLACGGNSSPDSDGSRPPALLGPAATPEPGRVALGAGSRRRARGALQHLTQHLG